MPQGVVIAVRPGLVGDFEWIESFVGFLDKNYGLKFRIGVIETCDTEGEPGLRTGDKLLFIVPAKDYPTDIEPGDACKSTGATKVKFKTKKDPFLYIYEIKTK